MTERSSKGDNDQFMRVDDVNKLKEDNAWKVFRIPF